VIIMKGLIPIFKLLLIILFSFIIFSCTNSRVLDPDSVNNNVNLDGSFSDAELINNLTSLVVYQNGSLVKQVFRKTVNESTPQDIRSVTKSVTSLLIGIAIDKGFIQSVEQSVTDFSIHSLDSVPSILSKIKISHLLSMTSGFKSDELSSVYYYNNWIQSNNQIQYLFDMPLSYEPGKQFSYNSAAFHLLSIILSHASNMQTSDFAKKYLSEPLGMEERTWEKDHQGFNNGSAGLELSPNEMVKIGQLILNHGKYNGKQIVSSRWVDQMITTHVSTNGTQPYGTGYGYGWWTGETLLHKYVFANGYGGQFIVIVPDLNLIVAATNYWYGIKSSLINDQWNRTINLIMTQIVPEFE
jgi:CubicO group peptidase (beta-lactamase class C family)